MKDNEIKKLLLSEEYDFLRKDEHLGKNIIYLTFGGSHAYGTNIEGSDVDIRGITGERIHELLGLTKFEQVQNQETDTVIYAFNKIMELFISCNPNTIEMLGTAPEDILYMSEPGKLLRDNSNLFLSQYAQYSFAGYAKDQFQRLKYILAKNANKDFDADKYLVESMDTRIKEFNRRFTPVTSEQIYLEVGKSEKSTIDEEILMNINLSKYPMKDFVSILNEMMRLSKAYSKLNHRNRKVDDMHLNKHAMHLVRLYLMAIDIFEKEQIITKRVIEHDSLMAIRNGKFQKSDGSYSDDFFDMLNEYENRMKYAIKNTSLPQYVDMKKAEELTIEVNRMILKL